MTISTLLSLQHTSATVLNSESSDAGHLTDLAGYFQTTLAQQIVASNIDPDARAVTADQTLTGVADNAILSSGEELPVSGTGLPAEQTTLASLSASLNGQIGSATQDLAAALNTLPVADKAIERGLQIAAQYFNNQTSAQNISPETTSPTASTTALQRSVPVQYSAGPVATLAVTPEVQAALKLAARNGALFESNSIGPVTSSEQNRQQASSAITAVAANLLKDLPNDGKALAKAATLLAQNKLASGATTTGTQAAAANAVGVRNFGPFSFPASSAITNNLVQRASINQPESALKSTDHGQQGIKLDTSLPSSGTELAAGRPRLESGLLAASLAEQQARPQGFSERSGTGRPSVTIPLTASNTLNLQELAAGRLVNTAADSVDVLRDKFAEFNNTKALPTNQNTVSAQQSAVKLSMSDQVVSEPMLMLNRQTLNAESFRNTIKTALERGLGRTQDNAIRADHSAIGEARPLDGDNGRTIALPSVSGPQSINSQAATSASVFGGQMLDAAASKADAAAQLGQRIQWMLGSNARRANIQIDPPELGSVQIQVSQEDRQTTVSFVTQNANARELIEQSLPRLREHLENLGIELADANVEQQSNKQFEQEDGNTDAVARSGIEGNNASDESEDDNSRRDSDPRDGGIDAYA